MLAGCRGRMQWPARGVYFFHETGENRSDTGEGPRVVRVGTHALKEGGSTTLWGRLSAHRGQLRSGGSNQRGSIFRLIVGTALIVLRSDAFGRPATPSDFLGRRVVMASFLAEGQAAAICAGVRCQPGGLVARRS